MMHIRLSHAFVSIALVPPAFSQTGIPVPTMTACDAQVQALLTNFGVNGAAFAMSRQGKLVYNRAFGNADLANSESTKPHHLFRIASVSKPITGVAIMTLLESGELALSDRVFGPGGILEDHPYLGAVSYTDTRINDITISQLLHHTAGWNRDISCFPNPTPPYPWQMGGCDPISAPLYVTAQLGESNPVQKYALVRFLMEHGLDHVPGTTYAYSNIGYLVLGAVIEQLTGMDYDAYVQSAVFDSLGICDAHLGHNLLAEKLEREAEYEGEGYLTPSCYGSGPYVPWEYGGWNLEAMDAHGGWVASARELVKLVVAVDGFSTKPDILAPATISTMAAPTAQSPNYACGWAVNSNNNWWHTGALDGTASMICRSSNGYTWALLLNKRITTTQANAFWTAIDQLGWNCIGSTSSWPTHDLLAMPSSNASDVSATTPGPASLDISCAAGNGDGRVIVVRPSNGPQAFPLDGMDYTPSTTFGAGDDLGGGNFVVSAGSSTAVSVVGLTPGASYTVSVFEYSKNATTGQNALYKLCGRSDAGVAMPVGVAESSAQARLFQVWVQDGHVLVRSDALEPGGRLELIDPAGRVVLTRSVAAASGTMDLGEWASGMFLVSYTRNGERLAAQRVIVAH